MPKTLKSRIIRRTTYKRLLHLLIEIDLNYYILEKGVQPNIHLAFKDVFSGMTARQAYLTPKRINNLKRIKDSFKDCEDLQCLVDEILDDSEGV